MIPCRVQGLQTGNCDKYVVPEQPKHSKSVHKDKAPLAQYGYSYLQTYPQDSATRSQQVARRLEAPVTTKCGVLDDLPPQEALDAFRVSSNAVAFRECGQNPGAKVHPDSEGMREVYDQLDHQLGTTSKGIDYFWDSSIDTCSPNDQKIKAVETVYVQRAKDELLLIAEEFRTTQNARRVHSHCKVFFAACRKTEILRDVPDQVFQAVWEQDRAPKKRYLSAIENGKALLFSENLRKRESCARALETVANACQIRTDEEYRRLVKPPVPVEVLFDRAIGLYRRSSMIRKANEQIQLLKDRSEDAELCLSEATKKYKPGARWRSLQCDQKRYVAEMALISFAAKQLKYIAYEFRTNREEHALILSKYFFSTAGRVSLLNDIEWRTYQALDPAIGESEFWELGNDATRNIARAEAIEVVIRTKMPKPAIPRVICYSYLSDSEDDSRATKVKPSKGTRSRSFDETLSYVTLGLDAYDSVALAVTYGPGVALPVIASKVASRVATRLCMKGATTVAASLGYGHEFSQLASSFRLVCCTTRLAKLPIAWRFGDEPEILPTPYDPPWHPDDPEPDAD